MKLGVISDLHLGDSTSTLVRKTDQGMVLGKGYEALQKEIAGSTLDYLVLLGDVFDFSITNWSHAYEASKPFLSAVSSDKLAKQIIYVPGNHDFSAWTLTMQQANVLKQIEEDKPLKDRWSVPAVIDSRAREPRLLLSGVGASSTSSYGGLFFDRLGGITFNVAYPNLYVIDKQGVTTLVTHGHYFEGYWSLTSSLSARVLGKDVRYSSRGPECTIEELVAVNFPFNELASSGLGQAGPLTPVIRQIQLDAKMGRLQRIRGYLANLRDYLDEQIGFEGIGTHFKELATDKMLDAVVEKVLATLKTNQEGMAGGARYNEQFFEAPETRQNITRFLDACLFEIADILWRDQINIPPPSRVLFGHTHVPILSGDVRKPRVSHLMSGKPVEFWNTGGWLSEDGKPRGSALFLYDDAETVPWTSCLVG